MFRNYLYKTLLPAKLGNVESSAAGVGRGTNRSKCTKYLHSFHFISREIREMPLLKYSYSLSFSPQLDYLNFPFKLFLPFSFDEESKQFHRKKKIYSKSILLLMLFTISFPPKSSPLWNDNHSFVNIFIESDLVVIIAPISEHTQTMIRQIILITRREARRMERTKSISKKNTEKSFEDSTLRFSLAGHLPDASDEIRDSWLD